MSDRVRFITHQAKQILLVDLSKSELLIALSVMREAQELIGRQPEKSVLAITDVTGAPFDEKTVSAIKSLAKHNKAYIKASALVGVTRIAKVVLKGVEMFSFRRFARPLFPTPPPPLRSFPPQSNGAGLRDPCAPCHLSSGSFARHVFTTRSSAGGVIGWTAEIGLKPQPGPRAPWCPRFRAAHGEWMGLDETGYSGYTSG